MKIPKTDAEILDYIERELVLIMPPSEEGTKWKAIDDDSTCTAKSLRDAVITLAASKSRKR